MSIRFAPKLMIAAAAILGAAFAAVPASAQGWGHGPPHGYHGYHRPAPPPVHYAPPVYGHPYGYHRKRWAWRHYHRPGPPPWAYGPRHWGPAW